MSRENENFNEGRYGDNETLSQRHEVVIEDHITQTESDRAQWLDQVFGAGFKGDFDQQNPMDATAAARMLDDWKTTVPSEHHSMINELRDELNIEDGTGKAIPQIVVESLRDGNWQKMDDLQELCVAVLSRYGSSDGRTGWQKLPEINKRYVRMAEMSILLIDAIRISRDATSGGADDEHLKRMMNKLDRYAAGSDMPDSFRRGLSKPFRRGQPASADDLTRSTPVKRQRSTSPRPRASTEPSLGRPDRDFVDTTYNPITEAYEPVDDTSPADAATKSRLSSPLDRSESPPGSIPPAGPVAES